MQKLNLPEIDAKLKKEEGKVWIFDIIRKKYVVLTPEEWVRQHFIHFLIHELKYPKSLFRIESSLTYNKLQKRSDILIFDRDGKPWMLVECKSADIRLSQNALNQEGDYNMTVNAKYIAVSNGRIHFCCEAAKHGEASIFLNSFPQFS